MRSYFVKKIAFVAASILALFVGLPHNGNADNMSASAKSPIETPVVTETVMTPAPTRAPAATSAPTRAPAPTSAPVSTKAPAPTPAPKAPAPSVAPTPEPSEKSPGIGLYDLKRDTVLNLNDTPYFDFMDYGYASLTRDGTQVPYDLGYGIGITCEGSIAYVDWHNYTDETLTPGSVFVTDIYDDDTYQMRDLTDTDDGIYRLKTAKVNNGPYAVDVAWSNGTHTVAHLWVNGDRVYTCQTSEYSAHYICQWYDRKDDITALAERTETTPEGSLDWGNSRFAYPTKADDDQSKYRCDNQRWTDLAHQLVPDDSIPDAQKALIIHDWMIDNLAYDNYKVNVLGMTRAKYHKDWSGQYNMWDTRVGVCADFTTVYCMMLRSLGVPCTSLVEDEIHVWNLVWLNDEWVEIDVTMDTYRNVDGKDVNSIRYEHRHDYAGFGSIFDTSRLSEKYYHVSWGMYTVNFADGTGEY